MPRTLEQKALDACRGYEHWAHEARRLTIAIAANVCPRELIGSGPDGIMDRHPDAKSCFTRAADEPIPAREPDDGPNRRSLDAIAVVVTDCPECSQLVKQIRDRKHARKQFGIAKRRVRSIGKRAPEDD